MATTTNLCTKRGDTWQVTFTWRTYLCPVPSDWTARGEYSSECTYAEDDVVSSAGALYVALVASPGELPGTDWKKIADPVDLTGVTARLQAREPVASTVALTRSAIAAQLDYEVPVIDISSETGEITFTELEGKVHVRVEYTEMDILPGSYDLDLELTFPDGTVKSTATQVLEIVEDVTYV